MMDIIYRHLKGKNGGKGKPEYRLRLSFFLGDIFRVRLNGLLYIASMMVGVFILPFGLLLFGIFGIEVSQDRY